MDSLERLTSLRSSWETRLISTVYYFGGAKAGQENECGNTATTIAAPQGSPVCVEWSAYSYLDFTLS